MRILHAPHNIAGQASEIAFAQRKIGLTSNVCVYQQNVFEYPSDINLALDNYYWRIRKYVLYAKFPSLVLQHDIFHFHFGETLLLENADLSFLKFLGKKMVMHYWGTDVRRQSIFATLNPLFQKHIITRNEDEIIRMMEKHSRYIDAVVVADNELFEYVKGFFPKVVIIRQAINLEEIKPTYPRPDKNCPILVHAPSRRKNKGTERVIEAIDQLQKCGHRFEFKLIENVSNLEAKEMYSQADIIINQPLGYGYSILDIEGMALGKVVLSNIWEFGIKHYPAEMPIALTSYETLEEDLAYLLAHPQYRHELGLKGRAYVEKYHNAKVIAYQLLDLYRSI